MANVECPRTFDQCFGSPTLECCGSDGTLSLPVGCGTSFLRPQRGFESALFLRGQPQCRRDAAVCRRDGLHCHASSSSPCRPTSRHCSRNDFDRKIFPRMAAATSQWNLLRAGGQAVKDANPGKKLREPAWSRMKFGRVKLEQITVETRKGPRRKKRFCASRKKWKSLYHIRGGRKLT